MYWQKLSQAVGSTGERSNPIWINGANVIFVRGQGTGAVLSFVGGKDVQVTESVEDVVNELRKTGLA